MMLSKNKTQVWSNVPLPIKRRLTALTHIDRVLYSESRVIWQCVEAHLPVVEAGAKSFSEPSHDTPGRKSRRGRTTA